MIRNWIDPRVLKQAQRSAGVAGVHHALVGDEERASMTTLVREIRSDLDAAGRRRGHVLLLSVKVPDSVGYCREIGLDLERWLADGLVDFLVPGGYFQLNPWTESVALGRRYAVKVHASLPESRVRKEAGSPGRGSLESLRARALAAWTAGVDGIEMFNHFDPASPLWRELGDPALLRTLPKAYFVSVQGASSSRGYYPAGRHLTAPTLTPDAPEKVAAGATRSYELYIGDDLRVVPLLNARLGVRVGATTAEPPSVRWDDVPLVLAASDVRTWSAPVPSASVSPGMHRVTITAAEALQLDDVILQIDAK